MRVLISSEGENEPAGQTYMVVDGHGFLIDLSGVHGTLVDPTILRVEWGPSVISGQPQECGFITRRGVPPQPFFDKDLLKPYLDAWRARRADLLPGSE
jgi:hypothetical protein